NLVNRRAPGESAQLLPAKQSVMIRRTFQTISQLQRSDRDQRPMTYTTVNKTIHTTSTKCQYIDNTSRRSACSGLTAPKSVRTITMDNVIKPTITWSPCSPTKE